jgi:dipeptidyl aminopeptidase/acylaminoacyl peptidase
VEIAPHGTWPSPISAALVAQAGRSRSGLQASGGSLWWTESRPDEGGRVELVEARPAGGGVVGRGAQWELTDRLPRGASARSRAHEYGGGAVWLHEGSAFVVDDAADQVLHRLDPDGRYTPLTPPPAMPRGDRYADGCVTPDGDWTVCVRERHDAEHGHEPANELILVATWPEGSAPTDPLVVVSGPDFVAAPRISPDGTQLAWLQWDHPSMPWDTTELWVADLDIDDRMRPLRSATRVAGGADESVVQPRWDQHGRLWWVSDLDDWWNLWRLDDEPVQVTQERAEVGQPPWVFAQSTWCITGDGRIVGSWRSGGTDRVGLTMIDGDEAGAVAWLDWPWTSIESLVALPGGGPGVAALVASPTAGVAVLAAPDPSFPDEGDVVAAAPSPGIGAGWWSLAESMTFPTGDGTDPDLVAHALVYPPTSPTHRGLDGSAPPLLVLSHGGPTSAARPMLQLGHQWWTSRGWCVVDVDYRGSVGYGRQYRRALDGLWGVADVEDCVAAAQALVAQGRADPERLVSRGSSAGGFTTLAALTFTDAFSAGSSRYGIADLEVLARDTHKFEARYLDRLVGPWPEASDVYRRRSPVHHVDRLACPLVLLQGAEDAIVPPEQAEMMASAVHERGLPVALVVFDGEQHGFRRAETIERALEVEGYVLGRILGRPPADDIEPVAVENLPADERGGG